MHALLHIALAAGMLLTSFPHALCACGSARAAEPRPGVPVCPHCHGTRPARVAQPQTPCGPHKPCRCGACEVVQAVPPGAATTVAAPVTHDSLDVGQPAAECIQLALADLPQKGSAAEPLGPSLGSGRALTILLGHLLF